MSREEEIKKHCKQVQLTCIQLYGSDSIESYVGFYHDYIEDDIMSLQDIIKELKEIGFYQKEDFTNALIAITRLKNEKYFDYINRVKSNKIATRVKVADLITNLYLRELEPVETLKERYQKALKILLSD